MAKKYFQGKSGFTMLMAKKPALKTVLSKFTPFDKVMYLETDEGVMPATPTLKIVSGDPKTFSEIFKAAMTVKTAKADIKEPDNKVIISVGSDKFIIYKSGGRLQNVVDSDGNALTSKTPSTNQQEDGVRFILEQISKTGKFPTKEAINKDCKFEFGKDWHDSFVKTTNAVLTKIPTPKMKQYDFYRDSNDKKLDLLNKITDSKILPDSKDNWNPSDIWAVKKTAVPKLQKTVNDLHAAIKKGEKGIEDLNKFVETTFKAEDIIGISLKKVDGAKATISKIEVDAKYMNNLSYHGVTKKFEFNCANSYFDFLIDMKSFKDTINYRFRFRPRGASGELNTYGEGQPQTAKVWDGAISRDLLNSEFPQLAGITAEAKSRLKVMSTVSQTILSQTYDKQFAAFVKANKFKFVNVTGIADKLGEYEVKRAVVLLYYIYKLETCDQKKIFKQMYLAAKKMNAFSSVHYKVY